MRDRWDEEEDELDRGRSRRREPDPEPTLGETIDAAVRRVVTGIVIAGGLIALGVYSSGGGDPSVDYQIATTPDGHVYRLNSESGTIVACRNNRCWIMQSGSDDLDDDLPAEEQARQNAAAAAIPSQPQPQPQAVTAQPGQAQLPPPLNTQVPATR